MLFKPVVILLLIGISYMSCAARLSRDSGQYLVESLRTVGEWSDTVQFNAETQYYARELIRWNESWPVIVKLKLDSDSEYGFSETEDRPHSLSQPCHDDLNRLADAVSDLYLWALKMVDASGKLRSGVLLGNIHWVGMYDECLQVSSEQSQTQQLEDSIVRGMHCVVKIGDSDDGVHNIVTDSLDVYFLYGICIPRACNSTDALAILNLMLEDITDEVHAINADCSDDTTPPLDSGAIAVIIVLGVLGALAILGTGIDVIVNHWKQKTDVNEQIEGILSEPDEDSLLLAEAQPMYQQMFIVSTYDITDSCLYQFLIAFSVLANSRKVIQVEPQVASRSIDALHGIRFMSMHWVILAHTFLFAPQYASNPIIFYDWMNYISFQIIVNSPLCVDTFFLLGGTLGSYTLLHNIRAKGSLGSISWIKFFILRFLRLTPVYMMILAIYTTLFKYVGSGPFWPKESDETCRISWWTNLLYINNLIHRDAVCMFWSWYVAADMQFFLLMPVFVALLYKWTLIGGLALFVFASASSIATGVLTYVNEYPPAMPGIYQNISIVNPWLDNVYFVPWCRIGPYLIGILLGYILFKTNCKIRINRGLVVLGWCLAAVCNIAVLFGMIGVSRGHYLSPSISAVYASLHRVAWAVGVAWLILACATGNGGFVNRLLSLQVMVPLSRLTYAAYLIQGVVIFWYYKSLKQPLFLHDFTMVYMFYSHLIISYALALVFFILVEIPAMNLSTFFLRK